MEQAPLTADERFERFADHARRIRTVLGRDLSETDTRVRLVDPVLSLLGYVDVEDIRREVPLPATKEWLDYQLYAPGASCIVEAKASTTRLVEKDFAQCVRYAVILGVRWCLITTGFRWDVYDAHAKGELSSKHVATVRLDGDDEAVRDAWRVLSLFSKTSLGRTPPLTRLLVERVIEDELRDVRSSAVAALRKAVDARFGERVPAEVVVEALRQSQFGAESTPVTPERSSAPTPPERMARAVRETLTAAAPAPGQKRTGKGRGEVTLASLVDAGLLPVGATLDSRRGGNHVTARVVAGGGIELDGMVYQSPSTAASAARGGGAVNGWEAWLYQGQPIARLRTELLQRDQD